MARITTAQIAVDRAQRAVPLDEGSERYMQAQMRYLQAKVHHMSLIAVLQGAQQQRLWQELDRLREDVLERTTH